MFSSLMILASLFGQVKPATAMPVTMVVYLDKGTALPGPAIVRTSTSASFVSFDEQVAQLMRNGMILPGPKGGKMWVSPHAILSVQEVK